LIAHAGIRSGRDAYEAIRAGASLTGLVTALVYEGPGLARRINEELAALLQADGFANVADAVGADHAQPVRDPVPA
jgi:dihydroorotate dehydrogenase